MYLVETVDLSHHYSNGHRALDGVGLRVPVNAIYGFLGPNGAGKTTTLRLLLGLTRKQRGKIRLFGQELGSNRRSILGRIGSLIESPSLYPHLSAIENLRIWQTLFGSPRERIAAVLKQVDLDRAGTKQAGRFSLGMKQRLGLAVALLHQPSLLILDEPTNGLDPAGILEIRTLLQTLNQSHGVTIVVSSHLLTEMEKLATHIGMLSQGRLVFQGPAEQLLSLAAPPATVVRTGDDPRAVELLVAAGWRPRLDPAGLTVPRDAPDDAGRINETLVRAGLEVRELRDVRPDLEAIFLELSEARR